MTSTVTWAHVNYFSEEIAVSDVLLCDIKCSLKYSLKRPERMWKLQPALDEGRLHLPALDRLAGAGEELTQNSHQPASPLGRLSGNVCFWEEPGVTNRKHLELGELHPLGAVQTLRLRWQEARRHSDILLLKIPEGLPSQNRGTLWRTWKIRKGLPLVYLHAFLVFMRCYFSCYSGRW